jgi:hypothetical protein
VSHDGTLHELNDEAPTTQATQAAAECAAAFAPIGDRLGHPALLLRHRHVISRNSNQATVTPTGFKRIVQKLRNLLTSKNSARSDSLSMSTSPKEN